MIDALTIPKRRKVTYFDYTQDSFNPLKGMDYRKARDFVAVIDSIFPEGENTLTKKMSRFALLSALLAVPKPKFIDRIFHRQTDDNADAYRQIQTLLLSPVLKNVLCNPTDASLNGIVLARFPRATLGDFDSFVLANLLIANYKGHVVIPDFGFYACPFHSSLIRQNRLIAGINSFDEVPDFRNQLLLMDEKIAKRCTYEDAEVLANYAGFGPAITGHSDFIQESIE